MDPKRKIRSHRKFVQSAKKSREIKFFGEKIFESKKKFFNVFQRLSFFIK